MDAHGVAVRIRKRQADEVKGNEPMQVLRDGVEQSREVAVRGNGLGDLEQGAILLHCRRALRPVGNFSHAMELNIVVRRRSSGAKWCASLR